MATENNSYGATFEECVDELIALASNAGHFGNEAVAAATWAYASNDPKLKRRARQAKADANNAERALANARVRFLARWSEKVK